MQKPDDELKDATGPIQVAEVEEGIGFEKTVQAKDANESTEKAREFGVPPRQGFRDAQELGVGRHRQSPLSESITRYRLGVSSSRLVVGSLVFFRQRDLWVRTSQIRTSSVLSCCTDR